MSQSNSGESHLSRPSPAGHRASSSSPTKKMSQRMSDSRSYAGYVVLLPVGGLDRVGDRRSSSTILIRPPTEQSRRRFADIISSYEGTSTSASMVAARQRGERSLSGEDVNAAISQRDSKGCDSFNQHLEGTPCERGEEGRTLVQDNIRTTHMKSNKTTDTYVLDGKKDEETEETASQQKEQSEGQESEVAESEEKEKEEMDKKERRQQEKEERERQKREKKEREQQEKEERERQKREKKEREHQEKEERERQKREKKEREHQEKEERKREAKEEKKWEKEVRENYKRERRERARKRKEEESKAPRVGLHSRLRSWVTSFYCSNKVKPFITPKEQEKQKKEKKDREHPGLHSRLRSWVTSSRGSRHMVNVITPEGDTTQNSSEA